MHNVMVIGFFLLVPVLLILSAQKYVLLDKLGLVVLAFGAGILFSALGLNQLLFNADELLSLQTSLTEISIALAIPLLVFSMNIRDSFKLAGGAALSMLFAVLTVVGLASGLAIAFQESLHQVWQVAGMAVGAYTGGGPNMAAIKVAIEGDQAIFVTMTTYDILLSAMYLLFVMTLAKPIFKNVLSAFEGVQREESESSFEHLSDESANAYKMIYKKGARLSSFIAFMIAAAVVGLSVGLASLLPASMAGSATIIAITSLGIICSLSPAINKLTSSFHLGMYLVLVFCFTMGSMTDIEQLKQLDMALFSYIALIMLGSLTLHCLLCRVFKIDVDTFLIASSAAIMSVPFIPVVAGALKNRSLIVPGFAIAILGYVLGNYLGIATAHGLKYWLA